MPVGSFIKRRWKWAAILMSLAIIGYFHFSIAFYTYFLLFAEPIAPVCDVGTPEAIATVSDREFIFARIYCTTLATVTSEAVFISHQGANVMVFEYYQSDGDKTAPKPSVVSAGLEKVRISIDKVHRVLWQQQVPGLSIEYDIGYVEQPGQRHLGKRATLTD